jgi:drug/metabolite transporter (DMT)-like permease
MQQNYRVTSLDWLLLLSLVVIWGSSFVMSKMVVPYLDPAWIATLRLWIGTVSLGAIALYQYTDFPRDVTSIKHYFWLGLIGNALPFFAITWGLQFIPTGVTGLFMGAIPLIVIALAHFMLPGERLTPPRLIGFTLGFIGIVVLIGPQKFTSLNFSGWELWGQLAVLVGSLLYGINSVSTKWLNVKGSIAVSAAVLAAGAISSTAIALLFAKTPMDLGSMPLPALLALIGLGLLPTGLATAIWFKAVERTSPTFISMSNYLIPVYALIFGAILLGETIELNVLVALGLILCGIFISRKKQL